MPDSSVFIDEFEFEQLKKKFMETSVENIHIVCDFDRTLTYACSDGKKIPSLISVLRDKSILAAGYAEQANALFNEYHPIEINPSLSLAERSGKMVEWWTRHNELLIASGLNRKDIEAVIESGDVRLRDGVVDFLKLLHTKHIPLLILSSSGLGDAIEMYLEQAGCLYENIYIVTNTFTWDADGYAIRSNAPLIHPFNKHEAAVSYDADTVFALKDREFVILIGDSLKDVFMADGVRTEAVVKIGFLNDKVDELRRDYRGAFEVVIEGDGDFYAVMDVVKNLLPDK